MMKYFTVKIFIFFTLSGISQELSYVISKPDVSALLLEDAINDQDKQKPYRFGIDIDVAIDILQNPITENGLLKSSYRIHGEGAKSLHFLFDTLYLSKEASLVVKNTEGKIMLGPYNHSHNTKAGRLSTGILLDSIAIIELIEPASTTLKSYVTLRRVTYGYRNLLKSYGLGNSGACNINTICQEGIGWEDQIRSVAMIVEGGVVRCSGALINNTCKDGTPYFLTADHCLIGDQSNWVFLFNWESPDCSINLDGALNNSISGADVRANNAQSDFALLELFSSPPSIYSPYFSGWDRSGLIPMNETTIHHPRGDVKKITKDFDPVSLDGDYWRIEDWDVGTTEVGSSGSPLFNENHLIIGQLFGGLASCSNNEYDNYGRFDISWNSSPLINQNLFTWLDNCLTGEIELEGYDPYNSVIAQVDVACYKLLNVDIKNCTHQLEPQVIIKNTGSDTLTSCIIQYEISGQSGSLSWNGVLAPNKLDTIDLPVLFPTVYGQDTLKIEVSEPNGTLDQNILNNSQKKTFLYFNDPVELYLKLQLDDWGSETSWIITTLDGLMIEGGGTYIDVAGGLLVKDTFCLQRDSCYVFKILDTYGDGISDDDGYYVIQNNNLDTLAFIMNENFGLQEIQNFCATGDTSNGIQENSMQIPILFDIFPNPSSSFITIQFKQELAHDIKIVDVLGQVCLEQIVNAQTIVLNPNLSAGGYFIQAFDQNGLLLDQKIWFKQ